MAYRGFICKKVTMTDYQGLVEAITEGRHTYQLALIKAIEPPGQATAWVIGRTTHDRKLTFSQKSFFRYS